MSFCKKNIFKQVCCAVFVLLSFIPRAVVPINWQEKETRKDRLLLAGVTDAVSVSVSLAVS